jgi:hypothetical protein
VDAGNAGADLSGGGHVDVGFGQGGASAAVDTWGDLDVPDAGAAQAGASGGDAAGGAATSMAGLDGGGGAAQQGFDDPFAGNNDGFDDPSAGMPADIPPVDAPPDPEPQPDAFTQDVEAADQLADSADDVWDGLGQ